MLVLRGVAEGGVNDAKSIRYRLKSAQPPRLSFGVEQGENVTLPNRALHIPHDETILIIDKLNPNLCDLATRPRPTNDLDHYSMLDL